MARTRARNIHMLVAGGGELLDGFRAQAAEAGLGGRVHFLDRVPHGELTNVLRASDLFVLTTEPPESFGIVLIEAMACGLPAVATDYPGVRAVVDEQTGILIPAGDSGAAAEALDRLVDMGPEGRASMGRQGREKAERLWAWPALLDRMEAAYAEAIEARREKLGAVA
jgi:glycosyltransferase involved in cell wall biosynthesis